MYKRQDRLLVGDGDVLGAADVVQVRVLRPDARVVQSGGDGVNRGDLAVVVLAEIGLHAVENPQPASADGGGCLEGIDAAAGGLAADEGYVFVINEMVEGSDGVGAAADTGDDRVGQASLLLKDLLDVYKRQIFHRLSLHRS